MTSNDIAALLQQMTTMIAMVQNQQNDIDRLKKKIKSRKTDLLSVLKAAVDSANNDDKFDEIGEAQNQHKRKRKPSGTRSRPPPSNRRTREAADPANRG